MVKLSVQVPPPNKSYILGQRNVPQGCYEAPPLPCVGETGWRSHGLPKLNLEGREYG